MVTTRASDIYLPDWNVRFDDARNARTVRRDFLAHLQEWGSADSDFGAAALAFDELVSNVTRHAPGSIRIVLEWSKCAPILHVYDRGAGFVLGTGPPPASSETGRGLFLVSSLVGPLGVTRLGDAGTCVSVTLPVHRKGCQGACLRRGGVKSSG